MELIQSACESKTKLMSTYSQTLYQVKNKQKRAVNDVKVNV
jgi:hypothetical protein